METFDSARHKYVTSAIIPNAFSTAEAALGGSVMTEEVMIERPLSDQSAGDRRRKESPNYRVAHGSPANP